MLLSCFLQKRQARLIRARDEDEVGLLAFVPAHERIEVLIRGFSDRIERDKLASEAAAEVVREATPVCIVLIEHRSAFATELVREARDGHAVRGIARDDAE